MINSGFHCVHCKHINLLYNGVTVDNVINMKINCEKPTNECVTLFSVRNNKKELPSQHSPCNPALHYGYGTSSILLYSFQTITNILNLHFLLPNYQGFPSPI